MGPYGNWNIYTSLVSPVVAYHVLYVVAIHDSIQSMDLAKPPMYFQIRLSNLKSRRWTSHKRNRPAILVIFEKAAGPEIELVPTL